MLLSRARSTSSNFLSMIALLAQLEAEQMSARRCSSLRTWPTLSFACGVRLTFYRYSLYFLCTTLIQGVVVFIARLIISTQAELSLPYQPRTRSQRKHYCMRPSLLSEQSLAQYYHNQMSRVTKYLLMMPLAYIGYCAYQDEYTRQYFYSRIAERSEGLYGLQKRFEKSKSVSELLDVLETSCLYLRDKIDPVSCHEKVIDCEIVETDPSAGLLGPYFTRSLVSLTKYLNVENKKEGQYSIFFWIKVTARQTLRLVEAEDELKLVEGMLQKRERKCLELYAAQAQANSSKFLECVRKTEGAARLVERQLQRIALIRDFQSVK